MNFVWAPVLTVFALLAAATHRTLVNETCEISRSRRSGLVSTEDDLRRMNEIIDAALLNSSEKDRVVEWLLYIMAAGFVLLLCKAAENVRLGMQRDFVLHTILHHSAASFEKILWFATRARCMEIDRDEALVNTIVIGKAESRYIAEQQKFADSFIGFGKSARQVFDIGIVANEIFRRYQVENTNPRLVLSADIPDGSMPVKAHEERICCIIDNLLSNAVKYTDEGLVSISLSSRERKVLISVADTGIGIPAEAQKRIFERNARAGNVHDRMGTGWGLHETRETVMDYGGKIQCESEAGRGTKFTVTLPIAVRAPSAKTGGKRRKNAKSSEYPPPRKIPFFNVFSLYYANYSNSWAA